MKIRIGDKIIRNVDVSMSSDGRILTLKITNAASVAELVAVLDGEPKIEVLENVGTEVKAVYQGAKMTTISMEMRGGVPVVTATLMIKRVTDDVADKLREELEALGGTVEDQALVIGMQAERITAQGELIAAQTAQIAAQGESLKAMSEAVSEAHSAAETAQNAIKAIEEGIADA